MNITPISMNSSFKSRELYHVALFTESTPDDAIVETASWGGDYIYPITAGQKRAEIRERTERDAAQSARALARDLEALAAARKAEVRYSNWGGNYAFPIED